MTKCVPEIVGIRQKGESQNGGNKKANHAKFFEKRTFLTPWYAYAHVSFSENLTCLASLLPQINLKNIPYLLDPLLLNQPFILFKMISTETCLESCQRSRMELYTKIIKVYLYYKTTTSQSAPLGSGWHFFCFIENFLSVRYSLFCIRLRDIHVCGFMMSIPSWHWLAQSQQ